MSALITLASAVAAGYVLGRLRPGHRMTEWASWAHATERWDRRLYRWPAYAVMCAGIAAHPIRSYRNAREWRGQPRRRTTDIPLRVNRPHREDTP